MAVLKYPRLNTQLTTVRQVSIIGRDWKTFQNHDPKFPRPVHEKSLKDPQEAISDS